MQTSSLEALLASSGFWPQCLLALQLSNKKLEEARCFPPCRHLLGAVFKLRLLCFVPTWGKLQPRLRLALYPCWSWPRTLLPGLTSDLSHHHALVWWPGLLTCLACPFGVLWNSPLVIKLPPFPACMSPSAPGSLSPSEQRLPLLLPNTQPHSTAQVTCLYCFWFHCWAGQSLFRCLCMPLLFI